MTVYLMAYSLRGSQTARKIAGGLQRWGHVCRCFAPATCSGPTDAEPVSVSAPEWARQGFSEADAIIFCCAAGIAVRAIAPSIRSKKTDPAVLVVDELGRYAIPLLSGHWGGANELAAQVAENIGAECIVTTATDLNGVFAVDVFARKNHLSIESMSLAKEISVALLRGEAVGFRSDLPVRGELPSGLTEDPAEYGIYVSTDLQSNPYSQTLHLIPRRYAVGVGCKKGKDSDELESFVTFWLKQRGVSPKELLCLASIDQKKEEPGLKQLARKLNVPFVTFSAGELSSLDGDFSVSGFVKSTVGVGCVSERAAVFASGGRLVQKKTAEGGMTFALAVNEEGVCFE